MYCKGLFTNNKIFAFFDHLPPCVDIFYGMNVDKKWTFWTTYLPTSSCKRSLWTTPNYAMQWPNHLLMENSPINANAKNSSFVKVTQAIGYSFCSIEILSQIKRHCKKWKESKEISNAFMKNRSTKEQSKHFMRLFFNTVCLRANSYLH